jgi:prepilin-type N-terminal cleavage/methylation domain-containing protein/prepilin-type processing-associated H-X9-DG protein
MQATQAQPPVPPPAARGFTLIELLVVIGIIAILIGILLPALSMARQMGQQIQCMGHVRGIGMALEIFANDEREKYPIAGGTIDWGQTEVRPDGRDLPSWMEQLSYYVAAEQAAFDGCPTYPANTPFHYYLGTRAAWIDTEQRYGSGRFESVDRRRIRHTSAFVLGGDNNYKRFIDRGETNDQGQNLAFDADKDDFTQACVWFWETDEHWAPHHLGGLNVLFADAHVEFMRDAWPEHRVTFRYDTMELW